MFNLTKGLVRLRYFYLLGWRLFTFSLFSLLALNSGCIIKHVFCVIMRSGMKISTFSKLDEIGAVGNEVLGAVL